MTMHDNNDRTGGTSLPIESNATHWNVDAGGNQSSAGLVIFSHELPSGDVQDLLRRLHRHAKLPRHPLLARFLRECVSVLRQEVQNLPRDQRESVPPFHSVITLGSQWEKLRDGPLGGAWEGAFVCIYQVAMFIGHHEARDVPYNVGTRETLGAPCLAGISIGLFSAASVAVSRSLTDLVSYGAESVRMAFVFCRHVGMVSRLLENTHRAKDTSTTDLSNSTWASVITGLPAEVVQAELDLFHGQQDTDGGKGMTTALTRISISHVDHASVGITGPPTHLTQLFRQSKILGSSRHAALPISGGLCHVPNVYDAEDVGAIMKAARVWERWGCRPVQGTLLSPYTGTAFPARDAYHLIEAICTEALTKPLFFDKLAEGAAAHISLELGPHNDPSCQILHYRTSLLPDTIISTVVEKLPLSTAVHRQDLVDWAMQDDSAADQQRGNPGLPQESKLAVVGMACRMPGDADTPERLWELLVEGRDTHTLVPPDRFDLQTHFDPTGETENAVGTQFGNFISNPGHFDAGFFHMSPREAQQTDPMQRLALVTAYEALEMAGFVPNRTPSSHTSRVGTYYGQASDDYREVNVSQKIGTYGIPGTERAFGNGRINYFFNFQGPSFNVDTACSSGLAAVHMACSALWAGDADTVVAGGLNVITSPDIYCMLGKGHFLSPTGQCKVWDAAADGYCRGDGVGSVVIKRLEDALADNDVVLATIVAGATNHSSESISITQPHAGAQMDNYRQVMDKAGVRPLDVSFVELHGTGTQVGDAVESESVLSFFAPLGQRQRPEQRLHLGALKSNIGHGEAAAGIASLIKVLLMYRHGMIPRHTGIQTVMNPVVAQQLANRNANVPFENTPWVSTPSAKKRYSIVNSFGAHGGNTTLLLEDAPPSAPIEKEDRDDEPATPTCEVVCVSAKSKASLRGNVSALLRYLEAHPETRLKDLAYTTCARRMHHHIRIATSVSSTAQLRDFLLVAGNDLDSHAKHVSSAVSKVVVFAFSGQGCFYRGAGSLLFGRAPEFREMVLQLDRVVRQLGFPPVLPLIADLERDTPSSASSDASSPSNDSDKDYATVKSIDSSSENTDSGQATSDSPLVTQLALVVLQIALAQYWQLMGITPGVVIGHSLGEYAALCTAGVLSVADTLFLVGKRAELMMSSCEHGSHVMMSIRGASANRIAELCRDHGEKFHYEVSCINGREDTVVSGTRDNVCALRDMLVQAAPGLKCVLLDVPFAFHSAQMDPILDDFESAALRVTFKAPKVPVVSPLLGQSVSKSQTIDGAYLRQATRETVDFVSAIRAAETEGLIDSNAVWIDIGPHPVCTSFVRNCQEKSGIVQSFPSLRRSDDALSAWSGALAALHCLGLPVAWNEYFARREKSHRLLHLDSYHWNHKNYWIPYEGTWTLDKAHPGGLLAGHKASQNGLVKPAFLTSSTQQVEFEDIGGQMARMTAVSDIFHPDLLEAAAGHKINGRSVLTASIWADICLTVGEQLYRRLFPDAGRVYMDVRNMEVVEAQVVSDEIPSPGLTLAQMIRIEGLLDMSLGQTQISFYSASPDGTRKTDQAFATAVVYYEDLKTWQAEWQMVSHLVASRIDAVWNSTTYDSQVVSRANRERVSVFSQGAAYHLFANIVDYGVQYRGMHRVAMVEDALEATADVVLDTDRHGTWTTPPHWIDGAFQLAGFIMNSFGVQSVSGGDNDNGRVAGSSRDFFYITPGWRHLRLAESLEPGPDVKYRNYVRMSPVDGEPGAYSGDIYLLRGAKIVGVCAGIKFKRVPRALMPIMFPPQRQKKKQGGNRGHFQVPAQVPSGLESPRPPPVAATAIARQQEQVPVAEPPLVSTPADASQPKATEGGRDTHVAACIQLIASETGLDTDDLSAGAAFVEIGVDSLMSLTLADKIQKELGIPVKASVFLECPTVKDFEGWLTKHCS